MKPSPPSDRPWLGIVLLLCCATLWSLSGPLIKLLSGGGEVAAIPGITIAFYRSVFGGLIFMPFAIHFRKTLAGTPVGWPLGSVAAFTLMTACFVIATTQTAASTAIILQYTAPIWVFLLSPLLLKERPRLSESAILLLAMAGVAVIFFGNRQSGADGLAVALLSGLGYGALTVVLRGLRDVHPSVVVCINCAGSAILLAGAVAVWDDFSLTPAQFQLLAGLSVFQFAMPYALFSWALQYVEAHRASLILLLETVLNPIWTYLIVGESVPPATMAGGPLILAGVAGWMLLAWRREQGLRKGI